MQSSITTFIKDHFILSLATTDGAEPYVCTVFYVTSDGKDLYFSSEDASNHCQNILKNGKIACNIYKHNTLLGYEKEKHGVQLKGKAEKITDLKELTTALKLYGEKFIGAKDWYQDPADFLKGEYSIYRITVAKAKAMGFGDTPEYVELN